MPLESGQKFGSPKEEIAWLEKRLEEKKLEAEKIGEPKEQKELAGVLVKEYAAKLSEKVLAPAYKMPEKEIGAAVLQLEPETHDGKIEELLGILEEKGILNAVSVARALGPHIEDDFHRVLVQYLLGRIEKPGFSAEKSRIFRGVGMALYEVSFPLEEPKKEGGKTFKDLISAMEQFYSGMAAIASERPKFSLRRRPKPYYALELALPAIGEEIVFYAAIPREKSSLFEKQLLAVFPKAQLKEKKDDYNIFNFNGVSMGAVAGLKTSSILPIRTYDKLNVDPMEIISNAFSKLEKEGEGAALQIIISPAEENFSQRIKNAITSLKKGEPLKKAIKGEKGLLPDLMKAILEIFTGGPPKKKKEEGEIAKIVDEEAIKLLSAKASAGIMSANIRLLVSVKTKDEAKKHLEELKSAFSQFNEPNANAILFKDAEGKKLEKLFHRFSFRIFNPDEAFYLNTIELTSVYHFPVSPLLAAPKVKYLKAKDAPPAQNLPIEGLLLGKNVYREEETFIYMKPDDRRRHLYLVGQTGTGKSVLLQNLIIQDIKNGKGVCLIDPHGDIVKELLGHIPEERLEDVVYFDPADTKRPMGLNMLDYDPNFPEQKTFLINELLEIFNKLYNMSLAGGPMFEQYFRNAAMLVMDDPESGNTLLEIERVLTDKDFREYKISRSQNPVVKAFWKEIAEKAGGEFALQNMVPYITNKFDIFLTNEIMRPIIAQSRSAFDFRKIMDEGKILLINLSKGRLGDLNANLLGLIIVGKLLMAALSRTDLAESERRDFYLYIDEFQNVTTKSIATILSEARKYRLDLVIAHQFIGQLDEDIKKAVFGNVGSMVMFRVGADDAQFLEKQTEPVFNGYDLMNIENFNAYLKLLIGGYPARPFNIRTMPPAGKGNLSLAESAKNLSSLKYGRPRELVEEEIRKRYGQKTPGILE